jgi:hypothetical protein
MRQATEARPGSLQDMVGVVAFRGICRETEPGSPGILLAFPDQWNADPSPTPLFSPSTICPRPRTNARLLLLFCILCRELLPGGKDLGRAELLGITPQPPGHKGTSRPTLPDLVHTETLDDTQNGRHHQHLTITPSALHPLTVSGGRDADLRRARGGFRAAQRVRGSHTGKQFIGPALPTVLSDPTEVNSFFPSWFYLRPAPARYRGLAGISRRRCDLQLLSKFSHLGRTLQDCGITRASS